MYMIVSTMGGLMTDMPSFQHTLASNYVLHPWSCHCVAIHFALHPPNCTISDCSKKYVSTTLQFWLKIFSQFFRLRHWLLWLLALDLFSCCFSCCFSCFLKVWMVVFMACLATVLIFVCFSFGLLLLLPLSTRCCHDAAGKGSKSIILLLCCLCFYFIIFHCRPRCCICFKVNGAWVLCCCCVACYCVLVLCSSAFVFAFARLLTGSECLLLTLRSLRGLKSCLRCLCLVQGANLVRFLSCGTLLVVTKYGCWGGRKRLFKKKL